MSLTSRVCIDLQSVPHLSDIVSDENRLDLEVEASGFGGEHGASADVSVFG